MATEHGILSPPVEVMRPRAVPDLLPEGSPGGGAVRYSIKLDGFRAIAFALGDRTVLQTRTHRDIASEFPTLATALSEVLPHGLVLDGDVCAFVHGRLAFGACFQT
ncbi:hypothetical protein [Streptomyces luteireticuli]|uniref:ATP-dependent DNA ligase n=1 Tax=Streptomyces luteireticuli TaxID=173858 RepID=UPI003557F233